MRPFFLSSLLLLLFADPTAAVARNPLPKYHISIRMSDGLRLSGLLLRIPDSGILVYPGNGKEWKSKKPFPPVFVPLQKIEGLVVHYRKRALRGAEVGAGVSVGLLLASSFRSEANSDLSFAAIATAPLIGGVLGQFSRKKFVILGEKEAFLDFRKKFTTENE